MSRDAAEMKVCSVDHCGLPLLAKGLCTKHYQRMWKNGSLETTNVVVDERQRYGRLTTISKVSLKGPAKWLCACDCGVFSKVWASNLVSNHTTSCGCASLERAITHGQSKTPEYKAWMNMWSRCTNPKTRYWHRYGGRGISVCSKWTSFEAFFEDMGARPISCERISVDRINCDGDYEPGNCRWATQKTQARNTSVNVMVCVGGKSMTLAEAVETTNIKYNTVLYRLKRGWSVERALAEPVHA